MQPKIISHRIVYFGADPEFFFKKEGRVVGAEKVLPKKAKGQTIVIDGVQAEFNPGASTCRQSFCSNLQECFAELHSTITEKNVEVDFSAAIKVDKKELSSLAPENQQFGCSPSENVHGTASISVKDASTYYQRSAGGHIHLGEHDSNTVLRNPEMLVPILDILLGNTCVLIDRDPGNVERRKHYGRAGEYRTPAHGIEYRTLSNFWLRSYPLTSFVLALARFSVSVASDGETRQQLLSMVNMEDIRKAINTNDAALARKNFDGIKELVSSIVRDSDADYHFPLQGRKMLAFENLVTYGIEHYFPQDPMTHWLNRGNLNQGWERFAETII